MPVFRLEVTVLMVTGLLAACQDATAPGGELTRMLESEHYIYRFSPGDQVDTLWQETYHRWLMAQLDFTLPRKLEFYKYRDRAQMKRLTGEETNGWAEPEVYRFHTISPVDNHECVHAVSANLFGLPPALINEGFAVAHQTIPLRGLYEPYWNATPVHDLAREYLTAGRIPELAELLESRSFFRFDTDLTYPIAGSFVRYLIDTDGLEPVVELMGTSEFQDGANALRANFQAAFDESIERAWARWLEYLE